MYLGFGHRCLWLEVDLPLLPHDKMQPDIDFTGVNLHNETSEPTVRCQQILG